MKVKWHANDNVDFDTRSILYLLSQALLFSYWIGRLVGSWVHRMLDWW